MDTIFVIAAMAIAFTTALGGIELFIDCDDNISNRDVLRCAGKVISTARAAHRFNDFMAPQLAK